MLKILFQNQKLRLILNLLHRSQQSILLQGFRAKTETYFAIIAVNGRQLIWLPPNLAILAKIHRSTVCRLQNNRNRCHRPI